MVRGVGANSDQPTPRNPSAALEPDGDRVLLVVGDGRLSTYDVTAAAIVIGRGDDCEVVIGHSSLSRRHAIVRPGPPATVQDLGSTNGTWIAGELHRSGEPVRLGHGDGFRIGPFAFVLIARAHADLSPSTSGRDQFRVVDPTPRGVRRLVSDFATSGMSVLILGETGVGKEVLASTLHGLSGRRGALTRINCAALSETLLESELFGHEKGAFTGAAATRVGLLEASDGGTVFLDEIGEMPLGVQAKLLRAFEHREIVRLGSTRPIPVDVRFIAATNRDLAADAADGRFRPDLYFRLDGVTLVIPPLRERRGMIGALAMRFLDEATPAGATPAGAARELRAEVLTALEAYEWPGNVRELKAVMERAVVLARGGVIGLKHLTHGRSPPPARPAAIAPPASADEPPAVDTRQVADRERILRALDDCAGNQTRAAKKLGMSRTAFVTRLRIYNIRRPRS